MISNLYYQVPSHTKIDKIANKMHSQLEHKALDLHFNPLPKHIKKASKFKLIQTSFKNLVNIYLDTNLSPPHEWSVEGRKMTSNILKGFVKNGLTGGHNTMVICKGRVNTCLKWGIKNNIETELELFDKIGPIKSRTRVFRDFEMDLILNKLPDKDFQSFVRFAYYTGARRGELVNMDKAFIHDTYYRAYGKVGERMIRTNEQAKHILNTQDLSKWDYSPPNISKKFKKEIRKLNIKDGRFHDLRRTFGYNLIVLNKIPIFEVSKLLGHKKVSTTENHYAPLLVTAIGDFTL